MSVPLLYDRQRQWIDDLLRLVRERTETQTKLEDRASTDRAAAEKDIKAARQGLKNRRDRALQAADELLLRHRHEEQIARARTKAFVALGDGLALQDRDDPSALATHGRGQHLHRRREGSPGRSVENSNGVRARGGGRGSASIRQRHGKDVEATAFPEPVGESRQHLRIGEDE